MILELEVGPVAHGGSCVAHHDGKVVFVRHALPGEKVKAVVTGETKHLLRADAVEILVPSAERVAAPCAFAGAGGCGGCDWQHAKPAYQRALKAQVVREQLQRLAGLDVEVDVEELPGGSLGWRTRVHFAIDDDGRAGLRQHRSHQVVAVDRCLIAHPGVEAVGVEGKHWNRASDVEVAAAAGTDETVTLVTSRKDGRVRPFGVPPTSVTSPGSGSMLHERAVGRTWRVSGNGFWQVHPRAADTLVAAVLDALAPQPSDRVLDLYCGVGLFAGALAPQVAAVTAIEWNRQAVADARHNLADLDAVRIIGGSVDRVLAREKLSADLVVLDPPRSGAGRAVCQAIAAAQPRAVAYVACDPAALARDVAIFAELGYRLASLRAFDLFPMTHHVECVALLEKIAA